MPCQRLFRTSAAVLLLLIFFTIGAPVLAASSSLPPVTVSRVTVGWSGPNGLTLALDGVPVVRKSTLYIVKAGWTGILLGQPDAPAKVSGWHDSRSGEKSADITLETPDARCEYHLNAAPTADGGATVTVDLGYRLKTAAPALIEYAAGYLSGPVFQGATVRSATGGSAVTIPVAGMLAQLSQEERRILSPFTGLRFETRQGRIGVTFSGDAPPPVLFDARNDNQGWAKDFPVLWMGLGSPAPPVSRADGMKHAIFRWEFSPNAADTTPNSVAQNGLFTAEPRTDALAPTYPESLLILPRPKQMEASGDYQAFRLTSAVRIVVRNGATAEDRRGPQLIRDEIAARFGLTLPIVEEKDARGYTDAILIGEPDRAKGVLYRTLNGLPPLQPEGYTVAVSSETVLIAGHDPAGTLWGAQTTIQLLAADAVGPLIRPAIVHDWPTLGIRGAHLFYGKDALPFHEKLIDRVLSRYKMNTLFLQAEQLRWNADPAVAPNWAGSKTDVAAEIAWAKARGMTVYPLIEGYGHMEWLFNRPTNRAFAEDPDTPYAVDFSNRAAVDYLTHFVDEADYLFDAPAVHIGMDEIDMRGRFPYRSRPRTAPDLIISAARYWRSHIHLRGKDTWMWADMALNADDVAPAWGSNKSAADAAEIRTGLPKDITMVDWQYSPHPSYPSLDRLKEAGFTRRVAATWCDPEGIRLFTKAATANGVLGALITTWAGYESKEDILQTPERRQFTAMVLAADYFWNGGEGPASYALPYNAAEVFTRQWADPDRAALAIHAGFTVDLAAVENRRLPDWLGYGDSSGPTGLPADRDGEPARLADGALYRLDGGVVLLNGRLNPTGSFPTALAVPLEPAAREIRLLLATSHPAGAGTKVGTVTVERTDGKSETIDLIYGKNIAALTDDRSLESAATAYQGTTGMGDPARLRAFVWKAPVEGVNAKSVLISSAGAEAAPAVFAVTGLTK